MDVNKRNLLLAYLAGLLSMLLVSVIVMAAFLMFDKNPTQTPAPAVSSTTSPSKAAPQPTPNPIPSTTDNVSEIQPPTKEADNTLIQAAIGMNETDAVTALKKAGWHVRIVHRDGEDFILTADYSTYRANLSIDNNIVTKAEVY